jgi:hypothetical protein
MLAAVCPKSRHTSLKKLNTRSQNQLIAAGFTKNGVEIQQEK